ncbi:unnamed protein product [Cylindrotheca closterium]|uniref:DUF6824 domain-containing protein n=1 Tax=Cylindrotheca closterium TaxID=2856 RepID=A0AAD2FNH2_9STRA|nr:unnamed protein product [Cylindrotheca closterium]
MIHYLAGSLISTETSLMDPVAKSQHAKKPSAEETDNDATHAESSSRLLLSSPLPSELPDPNVADAMIAKEMSNTSSRELERAYFDVHGVISNEVQESPQMIEQSIQALQNEMEERTSDNAALLQAKQQDAKYVTNRNFLLPFLRSEYFDAKAAALRLARHFQVKKELFGEEKLVSDITQDDLDQETMDTLYSGLTQHLPSPDRSGRSVVVYNCNGQQRLSAMGKLKRLFYTSMVVFPNNEQSQKRGVVVVLYLLGPRSTQLEAGAPGSMSSRKLAWKLCQLLRALPFRLSAMHICYDSLAWSPVLVTMKMALGAFTRIRLRSHYGSHAHCIAALQGYGIQPCFFPIKEGGTMDTANYKTWLEGQRRTERRTMPKRTRVYVPGNFDVLFGKGSPLQNHIGNVKLRGLISDCKKTYEKTEKGRKHEISQAVIEIVKESCGLFLKQGGDDSWIVVDDAAAELKVSTLFRSLRGGKRAARKAPPQPQPQSLQNMGGVDTSTFPSSSANASNQQVKGGDQSSDSKQF